MKIRLLGLVLGLSTLALPSVSSAQTPAPKASTEEKSALKVVASDGAPKAIGPYSQAVIEGGFLFASGQIPLDPKSGDLVTGGIEASTNRVFDNLQAVLAAAGLTFKDVVRTTVYLTRIEDFPAVNAVYAQRMGDSRPARSTVAVAALPKAAPIEIDLIARTR
ncbi:MAG TPA: RidA family protein [Thermoanaerobaculia bacterium]|nr:RidA family protein [Thermoanaerobaculia bacterium]